MRILDRYVLLTFLKNYVISLTVLIGLYVAMDLLFRFDSLVSLQQQEGGGSVAVIQDIARYYFFQSFYYFVQLSGVIPVVAAAFTLMRMSRFSELTAFLAAGVPVLRVAAPIIVASIFLNTLLIADQELVIPQMIPQLTRKHDEMAASVTRAFAITSMQVDQHSLLVAARYYPAESDRPPYMEEMDLIERNDALEPVAHLLADTAEWDKADSLWKLTNGRRVTNLLPGETVSQEQSVDYYKGDLTPEEIALYHSSGFVDLLSTWRINQLLKRPKSYGAAGLYKVKHLRATQPFMNVILLLLAIPTVLTHDPKALKTAATKCLLLIGVAMGSVFLTDQMAGTPPAGVTWFSGWAVLMAWIPIFIFGPLAVWLLDHVRT